MSFLPLTREEMIKNGWNKVDFILVTGDAYVDHPSFGIAIIARVLENEGYKVGIIAQPDVDSDDDFMIYGRPRLGFMVTSGNIDSMVANYTVAKKKRKNDIYSAKNKIYNRPDRAVIVYSKKIRKIYKDIPIIIGGLEASLRRFAHYDYWDDKVRKSILIDSDADILSFGMGEKQTVLIADCLKNNKGLEEIKKIPGICYKVNSKDYKYMPCVECASFEQVSRDKKLYAIACRKQNDEQDYKISKPVIQRHDNVIVVQNVPMKPLNTEELDKVYSLPFEKTYHPIYEKYGGVPAIEEVEFSITHNRGCFGNCNFCSIAFHQGKYITTRSEESIIEEAKKLTQKPNFKGYIHDVGGPTANFRKPSCTKQLKMGMCKGKKCLAPTACKNLYVDHKEYIEILRKLRSIKGIKKVFIRSGIRFDYMMQDKDDTFMYELIKHHISGQLKVAPEHCCDNVLDCMGKPHIDVYEKFASKFYKITKQIGKEQYLVPYLMSSHPGCTLNDAVKLALFLKKHKIRPEQVQDFYPTPGTISTCMFYTEIDPYTMKKVYVAKSDEDKAMQRALLQYFNPKNKKLVLKALRITKNDKLIGTSKDCLIASDKQVVRPVKRRKNNVRGHKKK
ncbi:MAG: YgiQ family radical SAM protein [Clostridia bacterium]|nr:YgiQ family radical SAM protein [Clostridia bacterium]